MINWLIGPLRGLVAVLLANDSSRQIAAGVAIGVAIGFVPKATLIAVALLFLLGALRVNRAAGLGAAGVASFLTPWVDPFFHKLGLRVLTMPGMQDSYAWLYDAPLGPWIGFHNTVCCGAFLVGVYVAYPVYLVVRTAVDRLRPRTVRWIMRYRLGRVLLGVDLTTRLGTLS